MKLVRKQLAYLMSMSLVISALSAGDAEAAKKPALSKTKLSVKVGQSKKITVKNAKKKAKVTWKTSKKSIAKITKKKTKGKPYATVKGVKKGEATITAVYKLGKTKKNLKCKVTVKDTTPEKTDSVATTLTATATLSASVTPTPTATATPTPTPTPTPIPEPTPTPFPNLVGVSELKEQRTIPDVMTFMDGTPVTADNWDARAEEIRQMYQYYMYGMWRDGQGETLSYAVNGDSLKMDISVDGSVGGQVAGASASFSVEVNVPSGTAPEKGWPVIVSMGNLSEQEYALSNGYAVINYDTSQVSADSNKHTGAFYTLYPYNARNWSEQSGVLMAWAWGASKVLDALYAGAGQEYGIDPDYAIVGGVSRWGKQQQLREPLIHDSKSLFRRAVVVAVWEYFATIRKH